MIYEPFVCLLPVRLLLGGVVPRELLPAKGLFPKNEAMQKQ